MSKKILVNERDGKQYSKDIKIFESPDSISSAASGMAWRILQVLNENPMYPNELAKKLKIHEQKIYYHINKMLKNGLIEVIREESRHGATCKFFAPSSRAFGFELPGGETEVKMGKIEINTQLKDFFYEFIKDGIFDGSVIVGSPTQHGPFLTTARDGHYATQLGVFIGNLCSSGRRFITKLDTEFKAEESHKRNLIIIGGPVTNMVCGDMNDRLKIKFNWEKSWSIVSERGKYNGETDGIIAKIKNPWDENKKIILLSGIKFEGTKACILGLTQQYEKVLKGFNRNRDFYRIIRGLDKDGDGKVDDIEILE
ncbi:MAG: S-layer protein [Candidatus Aenigmarchaeota archaeon]|nr:S-layer protein [Candidatus Aenigmarchaeota archaeon]